MQMTAITVVERSANSKTGTVSATYAAQQTCPTTCPLKGSGCYAEGGMVGMHTRRMNASEDAKRMSVEELALAEAMGIAELTGELPLRMHVVGDATNDAAARLLGSAGHYHTNKHGQPVWTYTHAWREVERASWQGVSVLASCESTSQARDAMLKGYGAAVVVSEHKSEKSYMEDGLRMIPCPQQTGRSRDCVQCGLCWRADQLRSQGSVIAFAIHGQQPAKGKVALNLVQLEVAR